MSLFDRLASIDPAGNVGIKPFLAALAEFQRGELTGAEVVAMFDLDSGEQADAIALKNLYASATDKKEFKSVFEDWFYIASHLALKSEGGTPDPTYHSQAALIARLQAL